MHSYLGPSFTHMRYVPTSQEPGVESSIPACSHTFVEINHEIISSVILLPSEGARKYVLTACSS